jgi:hypothetical protein
VNKKESQKVGEERPTEKTGKRRKHVPSMEKR